MITHLSSFNINRSFSLVAAFPFLSWRVGSLMLISAPVMLKLGGPLSSIIIELLRSHILTMSWWSAHILMILSIASIIPYLSVSLPSWRLIKGAVIHLASTSTATTLVVTSHWSVSSSVILRTATTTSTTIVVISASKVVSTTTKVATTSSKLLVRRRA